MTLVLRDNGGLNVAFEGALNSALSLCSEKSPHYSTMRASRQYVW